MTFKLFSRILHVGQAQEWTRPLIETVRGRLARDGALLVRGARDLTLLRNFPAAARELMGPAASYYQGGGDRKFIDEENKLMSSDFTPDNVLLPAHNEMSYARVWPKFVGLFCKDTSVGNKCPTLIFDNRRISNELAGTPLSRKMMNYGVTYHRRYASIEHHDCSSRFFLWQKAFQTNSKNEVIRKLSALDCDFHWCPSSSNDDLLVSYRASAYIEMDGLELLFNQAYLNNMNARRWGEQYWQGYATYGNGEPMSTNDLEVLDRAHQPENAEAVHWEEGDLLILENHLYQHGSPPTRDEVRRQRTVLLYMGSPMTRGDGGASGISALREVPTV